MASVASLWPKLSQRQAACFQAVIKNDRLAAEECRDAELARNTFVQHFFSSGITASKEPNTGQLQEV